MHLNGSAPVIDTRQRVPAQLVDRPAKQHRIGEQSTQPLIHGDQGFGADTAANRHEHIQRNRFGAKEGATAQKLDGFRQRLLELRDGQDQAALIDTGYSDCFPRPVGVWPAH